MSRELTDCLIVGAGPVGLTLACQLKAFGSRVRIIDKLDGPALRTKAVAVWSRTAEIFEQMGLIDRFLNKGLKCYGTSFFANGKRAAHLSLDGIESRYNFALLVPQHETEAILRERLSELGVQVEYGKRLLSVNQSSDRVETLLESGESLESSWLVGCDGAHSGVRGALDLRFDGRKIESQWIVADCRIDGLPLDDEVLLFLHNEGPMGLFPLGGNVFRMVAETEPVMDSSNEGRAEFEACRLVKLRLHMESVQVQEAKNAGYFSIHERQVEEYKVGRVFLAGDSAHVHSPLGGQGMNTGIQDAHNLSWKLALVTQGLMRDSVLESYHQERHPVGEWLVQTTSHGTEMLTSRNPIIATFRTQAVRFLASLPPVKDKVRDTLGELEINYRDRGLSKEPGFIGQGWRFGQGVKAGERAPDGVVRSQGQETRLLQLLRGCRLHLLLFDGPAKPGRLQAMVERLNRSYSSVVNVIFVGLDAEAPDWLDALYLYDHNRELYKLYAANEQSAYLIRPDGYVLYRCQPIDEVEFFNWLDDCCTST